MQELIIKKSTFYSKVYSIKDKNEIKPIVEQLRKEYKKSRHICHAYSFIKDGVENAGFDDDGEPKGTAGRPILDLIHLNSVNNVLVVVIRYFGGIKLGAGGLIRAYRKSAAQAIDDFKAQN
ncbi:YigZ family protein [Mycoplasma sp. Ms02]|uniref:YigZ family protein n=1 Tax=Mycoplasma sp. Ms02 TaxID=353851 RepID=UPI001C8A56AC|nr:YigZ family protein [Mycoplasma sp. Ms02]QZE12584.1 YigZ family protein [Mycoplasma sp. Ms02]